MAYRFAVEQQDYTDYASGRVFYNAPGSPVLPIRLVREVFQRCQAIRRASGDHALASIYDPCCGSGYHLATLAYFHWEQIKSITASDIDADILKTAEKNLGLLTLEGLSQRKYKLDKLYRNFQKDAHQQALRSLARLESQLHINLGNHTVRTHIFKANGAKYQDLKAGIREQFINTVIADVPYGEHAVWQDIGSEEPIWQMLEALRPILAQHAVCAIVTDKRQKCNHEAYQQKGRFQIGKRRIFLLQVN